MGNGKVIFGQTLSADFRWISSLSRGISQLTFDAGLIAVNTERIGIIWVEQED
jgi:hypothetical protein